MVKPRDGCALEALVLVGPVGAAPKDALEDPALRDQVVQLLHHQEAQHGKHAARRDDSLRAPRGGGSEAG